MFKISSNLINAIVNKDWNFDFDVDRSFSDNLREQILPVLDCLRDCITFNVGETNIEFVAESNGIDIGERSYKLGSISYHEIFEGVIENAKDHPEWAAKVSKSLRKIADKIDSELP
jgi:hypothetical protein